MENKRNEILKTIAIILIVVAIGTFAVNQVLTYYYIAEFLKTPCKLCRDLNEDVDKCLTEEGKITTYWNSTGGWSP